MWVERDGLRFEGRVVGFEGFVGLGVGCGFKVFVSFFFFFCGVEGRRRSVVERGCILG